MMIKLLIRASKGKPLIRIFIEARKALVYAANPERIKEVQAGDSFPVGFPLEDVFEYDEALYGELLAEWKTQGKTRASAWEAARPWALGEFPT